MSGHVTGEFPPPYMHPADMGNRWTPKAGNSGRGKGVMLCFLYGFPRHDEPLIDHHHEPVCECVKRHELTLLLFIIVSSKTVYHLVFVFHRRD